MPKRTKKIHRLAIAVYCVICAGIFSSLLCAPHLARAAGGSTDFYIQADDSQISWTVPVNVHFSVAPDGTFRSADNGTFINNSVFPVHIHTATVTANSNVTLVNKNASTTQSDSIWTVLTASGGSSVTSPTMDLADYVSGSAGNFDAKGWNMAKASDTSHNTLSIAYEGAINEFSKITPESDIVFAEITWVASAG